MLTDALKIRHSYRTLGDIRFFCADPRLDNMYQPSVVEFKVNNSKATFDPRHSLCVILLSNKKILNISGFDVYTLFLAWL